ncbi:MAG: class I SAM-dependent methyltransferase [Verrucomicrobiota bacterium]
MNSNTTSERESEELRETLREEYRSRFADLAAYRNRVWKILTTDFFQAYLPRSGAVLDLGCGWGEFINNIEAERKFAMDLNPDSASKLGEGIELLAQDCSADWTVEAGTLDAVFTSNFFEHLPDKRALDRTLRHASRALKPGGRIL